MSVGGRGKKREQPLTLAAGTSPLLEASPGYSPFPGIVQLQEWQCCHLCFPSFSREHPQGSGLTLASFGGQV